MVRMVRVWQGSQKETFKSLRVPTSIELKRRFPTSRHKLSQSTQVEIELEPPMYIKIITVLYGPQVLNLY